MQRSSQALEMLCTLLVLVFLVFEASAAVPCPFDGPELLAQANHGRKALSAEPEVPVPSIADAVPIPYQWGESEITTPDMDSFKYEEEIDLVLESPLSDWAILPEEVVMNDSFTLAVRPIEVEGRPAVQLVGYFEAEFKTPGGRAFFEWLISTEGQSSLTDVGGLVDEQDARDLGPQAEGPDGAVVYTTALPTQLPSGIIPIALSSTHWQLCGPNELTYMAYPAEVPLEARLPVVQELDGLPNAIEYSIVFAQRVRQIDADTIKFSSVQWLTLAMPYPEPDSYNLFVRYYSGLYGRLAEHFETTTYFPETGDECVIGPPGVYGE